LRWSVVGPLLKNFLTYESIEGGLDLHVLSGMDLVEFGEAKSIPATRPDMETNGSPTEESTLREKVVR
jgi:hypothetical protein